MKRLALLAFLLAAVCVPTSATAAVPCRDRIYNDWYPDGKIATTYPIACYRDALAHIRADAATYSSLADDIRLAMQGALARLHGRTDVAAQVGKGGKGAVSPAVVRLHRPKPGQAGRQQVTNTLQTSTLASGSTHSSGGGIPTPIIVLGGLALLLAAVGAVGTGARRFRRNR